MMRELWVDPYYHRLKPDKQSGIKDFLDEVDGLCDWGVWQVLW